MPVDKAQIESYLDELGLPAEVRTSVLGHLTSNDTAATQFIGQRLRHDDYTRKTQGLSNREKEIQAQANDQVTAYAQQLGDAQKKIDKIMKDFQEADISQATANARLRAVKEKFNLSDDDVPPVTTAQVQSTPPPPPSIDIDARLKKFEEELVGRLLPDMTAMPMLTAIQFDMARQHEALLGKPLTREDMLDIVRESTKSKRSLDAVWKEKFSIDKLQTDKLVSDAIAADRIKQEEERVRKASEDALAGIQNRNSSYPSAQGVLGRKFKTQTDPVHQTLPSDGSNGNKATPPPQTNPQPGLSGADRAMMKWMERRNKGIPLGKEG